MHDKLFKYYDLILAFFAFTIVQYAPPAPAWGNQDSYEAILGFSEMVRFILIGWLFKTGVEIVLLPVTYRVVAFLKLHSDSLRNSSLCCAEDKATV
jgi:uncharacterized PurR-regulated membrane protein YhhQ (DUF165 family)